MAELPPYRCWVFDCDGVLLDSNGIKSRAFHDSVANRYGTGPARALLEYHLAHGGVSRFHKFAYFFSDILGRPPADGELEAALDGYAALCRDGLRTCAVAEGLEELMAAIPIGVPRIIVSGGAQDELRQVFAERGLDRHFTAIFGSPDTKSHILSREISAGRLQLPGVMIGDSRLDFEAAQEAGLDFVFASGWSEFHGWQNYFWGRDLTVVGALGDLVPR